MFGATEDYQGYRLAMWLVATASLFLLAVAALSYVSVYKVTTGMGGFYVSGEGKAGAIPDIAQFSFGVVTQGGKKLADLQKQNSERANQVLNFLESQGLAKKDIKTEEYDIEPRYQYFSCPPDRASACPPPEIVGYTVRQRVLVKVRDLEVVGELLAGVVEKGANEASQLSFVVDDPAAVESEARAKAITQAKEKAKKVAQAGGFRLGKLLEVQEVPQFDGPIYPIKGGFGGELAAVAAPTIEPGSKEVIVRVNLRYEIK